MPTHTELSHSQPENSFTEVQSLGRYSTLVFTGKCSWRISVHRWFISFQEREKIPRMFAGEGGPERTNKRFHYVSAELPAKRLSTALIV
jgi:methylmalonyl-CoA mutase